MDVKYTWMHYAKTKCNIIEVEVKKIVARTCAENGTKQDSQ